MLLLKDRDEVGHRSSLEILVRLAGVLWVDEVLSAQLIGFKTVLVLAEVDKTGKVFVKDQSEALNLGFGQFQTQILCRGLEIFVVDALSVCFVTEAEESLRCQLLGPELCNVLGKRQKFRILSALLPNGRAQRIHASAQFVQCEPSPEVRLDLDNLGL